LSGDLPNYSPRGQANVQNIAITKAPSVTLEITAEVKLKNLPLNLAMGAVLGTIQIRLLARQLKSPVAHLWQR
jgi:hypothetical protein